MSTVEATRKTEGNYLAVHAGSGVSAEGDTEADALEALAELLRQPAMQNTDENPRAAFDRVSERVQKRVRERGADEDIVEDAIEWVRSQ